MSEAEPAPRGARMRVARGLLVVTLVSGFAALVWFVPPMLSIATGFYAKVLCSEVFVAGRSPETVVAQDFRHYHPRHLLAFVDWSVDREREMVSAQWMGLRKSVAHHRPGLGCAIGGRRPQPGVALAALTSARNAATTERATASLTPLPRASTVNPRLAEVVRAAFDEPEGAAPRRTRSVFIVRRGVVIAERYAEGFDAGSRFAGWSIAKSMVNAMVGTLVRDGRVALDDPVPVPEWSGDDRKRITWEALLRMSSGLVFDETYVNPLSDVNIMLFGEEDAGRFAAGKALADPGERGWKYASGTTNILTRALRRTTENYATLPRRAVFDPLGMSSAVIEADSAGNFVGSSFVYASAEEYARFGMLYAQDGVWEGKRILPEGWVDYSARPTPGSPEGRFGAHFWLGVPGEARALFAPGPPRMLHAAGYGGQRVTIVPDDGLVVVRLGLTLDADGWDHWRFIADVLAALD